MTWIPNSGDQRQNQFPFFVFKILRAHFLDRVENTQKYRQSDFFVIVWHMGNIKCYISQHFHKDFDFTGTSLSVLQREQVVMDEWINKVCDWRLASPTDSQCCYKLNSFSALNQSHCADREVRSVNADVILRQLKTSYFVQVGYMCVVHIPQIRATVRRYVMAPVL